MFIDVIIYGYLTLVWALVVNIIATKIGLSSWYAFIKRSNKIKTLDLLWLFVLYPIILGFGVYLISRFF